MTVAKAAAEPMMRSIAALYSEAMRKFHAAVDPVAEFSCGPMHACWRRVRRGTDVRRDFKGLKVRADALKDAEAWGESARGIPAKTGAKSALIVVVKETRGAARKI